MSSAEPDTPDGLTVRSHGALNDIPRDQWDQLANPPGAEFDPFLSWDFLQALEESGSAAPDTGWYPRHLTLEDAEGALVGALPLYLKAHSQGEYVFDHAWADAWERAGGQYYPKMLSAVPFTPVTGRRILASDPQVQRLLVSGGIQAASQWNLASWHITFPDQQGWQELGELGLLRRIDRQYIWRNQGYSDYADFLDALSSRKRKALRKEREAAQAELEIEQLTGDDLRPEHWDVFFACYQDTGSRKWGFPYLNRAFFDLIHQRLRDKVLLVMAKQDGRYIAAALNFIGSHALYGRYWGRLADHPFLHFELCYHQAIDAAIALKLDRVEAGAQGEHKLARGYLPSPVYSAHYISDDGFRGAVSDFLDQERPAVLQDIELQRQESPFKAVEPKQETHDEH